ncbi:MAG: hypothetical protein ACI822_002870 [Gammaproteobacteria bacterium]
MIDAQGPGIDHLLSLGVDDVKKLTARSFTDSADSAEISIFS